MLEAQEGLGPPPGVLNLPHSATAQAIERLRTLPSPVRELLAGGIAGATAKSTIAPLERVKILFQTGKLRGTGLWPTLRNIYETEGWPGLFRGNGASVLRVVPYAAVHFWCYEHYRRLLVGAGALGAQGHRVPPLLDLLAGAAAGSTAVLATYPLDLVRTRLAFMTEAGGPVRRGAAAVLQRQHAAAAVVQRPVSLPALAAALRRKPGAPRQLPPGYGRLEGAPGLALFSSRGCSSGACASGRGGLSGAAARLAAGLPLPTSAAGAPACAARLQGQGAAAASRSVHTLLAAAHPPPHAHHTIRSMLAGTLRAEGFRGLYHGVGASLWGILPYAGLKFFTYQHLKQWYTHSRPHALTRTGADGRARLPVPVMLAFGAAAGLVAQTATYPLDVVRRQMQVEGLKLREAGASSPTRQLSAASHQLSLRSAPQALALLARTQGWRCLYAGLSINYLKVVPSTAIGFTIYDFMKSALALPTNL